ncbi:MAG: hypothetical protein AAFY26_14855 [Cyanobacteria bacterium J06638_22]
MTSQKVQIQALIQSIDGVLSKASPRLPWVMAGEAEQQRLVLEQTRQYLVTLQQQADAPAALPGAAAPPALPPGGTSALQTGESAQQVLQAVLEEVTYLRTNIMQPMRSDVDRLRQERDELEQEIQALQAQRQQYALPPQGGDSPQVLSEFLQSLMGRLQENLTVQVSEIVSELRLQSGNAAIAGTEQQALTGAATNDLPPAARPENPPIVDPSLTAFTPQERLEQLQRIQAQSDQLLLKLDTTLEVIFESLQRNIHTYEESLSRGLDKMHTLGHQGEAIFAALVNRLAQQLGHEASSYLQASLQSVDWQALPGARPTGGSAPVPLQGGEPSDSQAILDSLLSELTDGEPTILQSAPPMGDRPALSATSTEDFPDLNLGSPASLADNAAAIAEPDWATSEKITTFQLDEEPSAGDALDDEEMTIFQMEPPLLENQVGVTPEESEIEDIDSALELLNQISTDLAADETDDASPEAEVASPEGVYNELDALYESLFGTDFVPPDTERDESPIDRHVADTERWPDSRVNAMAETHGDTTAAGDDPDLTSETDITEVIVPEQWPTDEGNLEASGETLEDLLFDGLGDLNAANDAADTEPPIGETAASVDGGVGIDERAERLSDLPPDATPQAVENLLFDEVPVADAGEQEETLLLGVPAAQNLPADVITSLEDLMHLENASASSLDLLRSEGITDEDVYIAAAPDEDLLAEDEAPRAALDVTPSLVEQLDAELAQLEEGATVADLMSLGDPEPEQPTADSFAPDPAVTDDDSDAATSEDDNLFADFANAWGQAIETSSDEAEAIVALGLPDLGDSAPPPPAIAEPTSPPQAIDDEFFPEGVTTAQEEDNFQAEDEEESDLGLDDWLSEELPPAPVDAPAVPTITESLTETEPESSAPSIDTLLELEERVEDEENAPGVGLPPDREELTLDDFQSVMAMPDETVAEELVNEEPVDEEPIWASFGAREETDEDDPERTLLIPPQASTAPPHSQPTATAQEEPPSLERFSNYLIDTPASDSAPAEQSAPDDEPLDLAALLDGVEDTPDAVAVPPPGEDESLASFAEAIDTAPSPTASEDAFTLEGLGGLFEDVETLDDAASSPSTQPVEVEVTPSTQEVSSTATEPNQMPSEALGSDFGLAEVDFYAEMEDHVEMASGSELDLKPDPLPEAESGEPKKKDLSAPTPEASTPPTADVAIASDESLTSIPADEPAEVVDLSDQLLQAMGLSADETAEEALSETVVEDWSDADFSLVDLAEDFSGASGSEMTDPDALALLQELDARATSARQTPSPDPAMPFAEDQLEDQLSDLRNQEEDLDFLISPSMDPLDELYDELEPPPIARESRRRPIQPIWYLGIDLGTTGISAVLLNRQTQTLYPIYWLEMTFADANPSGIPAPETTYRLPASVYLHPFSQTERADVAIAPLSAAPIPTHQPDRFPLQDFKPYLQAGIPYSTPDSMDWEPVLRWTEQRNMSLSQMQQALRTLLATLNCLTPELNGSANTPVLSCGAVGLSDERLQEALQNLAGVIVSNPTNSTDTYRFNVREAVLTARLVDHPEQIYWVEEAIATLLSALPSATETPIQFPDHLSPQPDLCNMAWRGGTLGLNAGASFTEMGLANLPNTLQTLSHQDIAVRTIPYGGNALDQDILCQLVYPAWVRQAHRPSTVSPAASSAHLRLPGADSPTTRGDWTDPWAVLGWEQLTLPIVGDPDPAKRYALQRQLLSSPVGLGLLEVAQHLKRLLQQQDRVVVSIGEVPLVMTRQDLASRVLLPYIQRLNRELNGLLTQRGLSALDVNQILCAGGTASLAAIARWLRQKFPNATFVQDGYPLTYPPTHNQLAACGRVAVGLATVPLHPHVLNSARHQYSDYFLLMELLRTFPEAPITVSSLLQMLERRGINTQSCQAQLLALLQGYLPPGLVPIDQHTYLLTQASQHNPDYQALLAAPLFIQDDAETYRPNPQQWPLFRRYLDTLLATSYQKLTAPLGFGLQSGSEVGL